jgi:hypothetical protein
MAATTKSPKGKPAAKKNSRLSEPAKEKGSQTLPPAAVANAAGAISVPVFMTAEQQAAQRQANVTRAQPPVRTVITDTPQPEPTVESVQVDPTATVNDQIFDYLLLVKAIKPLIARIEKAAKEKMKEAGAKLGAGEYATATQKADSMTVAVDAAKFLELCASKKYDYLRTPDGRNKVAGCINVQIGSKKKPGAAEIITGEELKAISTTKPGRVGPLVVSISDNPDALKKLPDMTPASVLALFADRVRSDPLLAELLAGDGDDEEGDE